MEPRRVFRYDTSVDRFPYPLLSTVSSSASGFFDRDIDTTSSPPRTRIPATPAAVRPIGRTCVIGKRFANPPAEARTTSSSPCAICASMSASPSLSLIARMPETRMFWNSARLVRLIRPFFVA